MIDDRNKNNHEKDAAAQVIGLLLVVFLHSGDAAAAVPRRKTPREAKEERRDVEAPPDRLRARALVEVVVVHLFGTRDSFFAETMDGVVT